MQSVQCAADNSMKPSPTVYHASCRVHTRFVASAIRFNCLEVKECLQRMIAQVGLHSVFSKKKGSCKLSCGF